VAQTMVCKTKQKNPATQHAMRGGALVGWSGDEWVRGREGIYALLR